MNYNYRIKTTIHRFVPIGISSILESVLKEGYVLPFKYYAEDSDNYYSIFTSIKNGDDRKVFKRLRSAFLKRRVNFDLLDREWWRSFYYVSCVSDREGRKEQRNLIQIIRELKECDFKYWELLHFYSLCLRLGLFELGYEFRKLSLWKASKDLIEGKLESGFSISRGLSALLEEMRFDECIFYFKKYYYKLLDKDRLMFNDLFHLYGIEINISEATADTKISNYSIPKLHKLVHRRKVAIVGPMKTETKDAGEIDSYDIVCRCNYREKGVGIDTVKKGVKCNITIFSNHQLQYLISKKQYNWPLDIDLVLYRTKKLGEKAVSAINKHYQTLKSQIVINSHSSTAPVDKVLFNSTLNAVPLLAIHMLLESPQELKIFHTDFMLTVNRLDKYYPDESEKDLIRKKRFLQGSKHHDPVTQFCFLKSLYLKNLIKCDQRLEEVLCLTPDRFMSELQSIYGYAVRLKLP